MGVMSLRIGVGVISLVEGAGVMSPAAEVEVVVIGWRRGADVDGPWHEGRNFVVFTAVSQVPCDSVRHIVSAQ